MLQVSIADAQATLQVSVAEKQATLQVSVADAQATLQVSVAEKQAMLQVSVADSKATLLVSIAFLTTKTATTPLTGYLVSVSCTLGSTTNATLKLHFFFQNPVALVVKN